MWSDFGYDDDIPEEYECDLDEERPNPFGHNITTIKTSQFTFARTLPWYTTGFK